MTTRYVPDHEALSVEEITTLLYEAMDEKRKPDASIKRLVEIEDRLMEKLLSWSRVNLEVMIDELYVTFLYGSGQSVDDLAVQLYQLMKAK